MAARKATCMHRARGWGSASGRYAAAPSVAVSVANAALRVVDEAAGLAAATLRLTWR